jgi:polyisoprenoid-binding protein YceI
MKNPMKNTKIVMMAMALVSLPLAGTALRAQALSVSASGAKKITLSDKVGKNQFTWNSDAPLEKIQGTAEGVTGAITLDPKNLSTLRGTVSASVATMKTGNTTRDGHLQGNQWLDAAKYPTISFVIGSVSGIKVSGNSATGTATGKFTMHGVTKNVSIPFKLTYIDASAKTAQRAPGDLVSITAEFDVALADYNVAGSKGVVGSKVGQTINVKAQLFGSTGL